MDSIVDFVKAFGPDGDWSFKSWWVLLVLYPVVIGARYLFRWLLTFLEPSTAKTVRTVVRAASVTIAVVFLIILGINAAFSGFFLFFAAILVLMFAPTLTEFAIKIYDRLVGNKTPPGVDPNPDAGSASASES